MVKDVYLFVLAFSIGNKFFGMVLRIKMTNVYTHVQLYVFVMCLCTCLYVFMSAQLQENWGQRPLVCVCALCSFTTAVSNTSSLLRRQKNIGFLNPTIPCPTLVYMVDGSF